MTLCEPAAAVDAVQGAAQAVALVAAHVKVAVWPAASEAGAALNVTLGLAFTVTTALAAVVPPAPVQFIA